MREAWDAVFGIKEIPIVWWLLRKRVPPIQSFLAEIIDISFR